MVELAAITIDVDSLRCYQEIHGLAGAASHAGDDPIYTVAMPRFAELLEKERIAATLFLIGRDAPAHAEVFAPMVEAGSEVASHSFAHDYRLTLLSPREIAADLGAADAVLRPLNGGREIEGFRAPGYNVTTPVLTAVVELGYRYDSSLLPSPAYWAARALALAVYARMGRPSRSLRGRWEHFAGPLAPHRIDPRSPLVREAGGVLAELPMACDPVTRIPFFGTTWTVAPAMARAAAYASARRLRVLNFEMHAIDLLDRSDHPALARLAESQRDLAVPARAKLAAFADLFHRLAGDARVVPLREIAVGVS